MIIYALPAHSNPSTLNALIRRNTRRFKSREQLPKQSYEYWTCFRCKIFPLGKFAASMISPNHNSDEKSLDHLWTITAQRKWSKVGFCSILNHYLTTYFIVKMANTTFRLREDFPWLPIFNGPLSRRLQVIHPH